MAYAAYKALSAAALMPKSVRLSTHSSYSRFSFREMCFICGDICVDSKDKQKVISGSQFDDKIKDIIQQCCYDDWAVAVQGRMQAFVLQQMQCIILHAM